MGVMCGTLDLVQRAYLGVDVRDGVVYFDPKLIGPARRAVAADAVPRHPDQGDGRSEASSRSRLSPTGSARASGSASARTSGSWARTSAACSRSRSAAVARRLDGRGAACTGAFAARSSTWTACSSTPRTSGRGGTRCEELMDTQWSDIRGETSYSPQRFTPDVYRESIAGKPRMSGARAALDHFHVPDAGSARRGLRPAQAADGRRAHRGRRVHRVRRRAALRPRAEGCGDPAGGGVVVQERRAGARAGPARTGPLTCSTCSTRTSRAVTSRTASPIRRSSSSPPGSWASRRGSASWSRTPSRASRLRRRAAWRRSGWPAPATRTS